VRRQVALFARQRRVRLVLADISGQDPFATDPTEEKAPCGEADSDGDEEEDDVAGLADVTSLL
jgi:hypothetical protein